MWAVLPKMTNTIAPKVFAYTLKSDRDIANDIAAFIAIKKIIQIVVAMSIMTVSATVEGSGDGYCENDSTMKSDGRRQEVDSPILAGLLNSVNLACSRSV